MSAINNTLSRHSQEFQLLQPESSSDTHSDEVFISLNQCTGGEEEMTMGIVIEEETFIVLDRKQSAGDFTSEDWRELVQRKKREIAAQAKQEGGEGQTRLTLRQRTAILGMPSREVRVRKGMWEMANWCQGIEQQFSLREKSDEQSKQEILTILCYQLAEGEVRSLKQNVLKMHKVVKAVGEHRSWSTDALRVYTHEKEIMQWIYDSLMRYAIEDQQVRYCKGLEYICLGIVVAYPFLDLPKYSQLLHHFLHHNSFRQLYQQGSPRFFRQLQRIRQALREDSPLLCQQIEQSQGDFKNLFVTYFRSCLIYKLNNPEVIRQIFQLLFVEGIPVMKTILVRILTLNPNSFLQQHNFLQHLSTQIVTSYFQGSNEAAIQQQFNELFLI